MEYIRKLRQRLAIIMSKNNVDTQGLYRKYNISSRTELTTSQLENIIALFNKQYNMPTYISGSAKEINGKYGAFLNISLKHSELQQYVNDKGYINLTISPRKEVGQYGDTHTIVLNEWKPDASKGKGNTSKPDEFDKLANERKDLAEEVPF